MRLLVELGGGGNGGGGNGGGDGGGDGGRSAWMVAGGLLAGGGSAMCDPLCFFPRIWTVAGAAACFVDATMSLGVSVGVVDAMMIGVARFVLDEGVVEEVASGEEVFKARAAEVVSAEEGEGCVGPRFCVVGRVG
jgi:hypothetical protein